MMMIVVVMFIMMMIMMVVTMVVMMLSLSLRLSVPPLAFQVHKLSLDLSPASQGVPRM